MDDELISVSLGRNARRIRRENDVSQAEIAKYLGIKQSAISRMESGSQTFSPEAILAYCKLCSTTPNALFGYNED